MEDDFPGGVQREASIFDFLRDILTMRRPVKRIVQRIALEVVLNENKFHSEQLLGTV